MNYLTLKALMAALIAAGYRANYGNPDDRNWVASNAVSDAEAILGRTLKRATTDDNQPVVYTPEA